VVYFILLILVLAFTIYEELHLRRYLYARHETLLAGSLPNFLAVVIFSLAYMAIRSPADKKVVGAIGAIVMGLWLYEVLQLWMPHMVFDVGDMIASAVGGAVSFILIYIVSQLF